MRIVVARVTPVRLPLRRPLASAHGEITAREGGVLALEDDAGHTGLGEALPLAGFGLETPGEAVAALGRMAGAAVAVAGPASSLDARLDAAEQEHPSAPCARAALDVALHDLAAQRDGLPLAAWLAKRANTQARQAVVVSRLLASSGAEAAAAEAQRAVGEGFGTLKIKVGDGAFEADQARVASVRQAIGPEVALRLDANGAWSERAARQHIAQLAPYRIELLEQPVAAGETAALGRLRAAAPFPIAADEAVRDEATAASLLAAGAADLLVLKPAALGGLRSSSRIAARARQAGVGVVVTAFLDSALGAAAALQLAASLPEEPYAAGLATRDRLLYDLAPSPTLRDGSLRLPAEPGLGQRLDPERLARVARGRAREARA